MKLRDIYVKCLDELMRCLGSGLVGQNELDMKRNEFGQIGLVRRRCNVSESEKG